MPDPLVVQAMRQHKLALLAREEQQMFAMATRWLQIEKAVEGQMTLLAQELIAERLAGRATSQAKLYRMERYKRMMGDIRGEINRYNGYATGIITVEQRTWGQLGLDHAVQAIQLTYYETGAAMAMFGKVPYRAVENLVGLLGNGKPLMTLLDQVFGESAMAMSEALIHGTAVGWNPRKTARAMRDGLAQGLGRELTIARTEQMRVYRESGRQQYEESGVVDGFVRIAAHQPRTCMACLAAEGDFYRVRDALRDHPNGRCSTIPKVVGIPLASFTRGDQWFRQQPEAVQIKMMGAEKHKAWKGHRFKFADLARMTHNATWGDGVRVATLGELVA